MSLPLKPIWVEGLLLGQQHLQQWDYYLHQRMRMREQIMAPFCWGLHHLVILQEALQNYKFIIQECVVVFDNGLYVEFKQGNHDPLLCDIVIHGKTQISIYLAIARNELIQGITGYPQSESATTWETAYINTADLYDPKREREVPYAKPNLTLLTDIPDNANLITMEIARLRVDDQGVRLCPEFIPPVTQIKASANLLLQIKGFSHALLSRWQTLKKQQQMVKQNIQLDAAGQKIEYMLIAITRALLGLCDLEYNACLSPRYYYQLLLELAAILISDKDVLNIDDLPRYQHQTLSDTLNNLTVNIISLIDSNMPMLSSQLRLIQQRDDLYVAEFDRETLSGKDIYLLVHVGAEIVNDIWLNNFVQVIKIAAKSQLQAFITSALQGVKLRYCKNIPKHMMHHPDCEYFYLLQEGDVWEQIVKQGGLAIFLPNRFQMLRLELLAIEPYS